MMKPANDNESAQHCVGIQYHELPPDEMDRLLQPLLDVEHTQTETLKPTPMEDFMNQSLDTLFPIFLQGEVMGLQEEMQALVLRHRLTQATIDQMSDVQHEIVSNDELSPEEKREQCLHAVLPYCAGNYIDANHIYNYTMFQNLIAERISCIVDGRIEGCGVYEEDGNVGEDTALHRAEGLHHTGRMLERFLVEYGVGQNQSRQIIRRFDTATEEAIANFLGESVSRG